MRRLRLYIDSTILITFVFGAKLEPERFNDVSITSYFALKRLSW